MIAKFKIAGIAGAVIIILVIALWVAGQGVAAVTLLIGLAAGWFIGRKRQEAG